MAIAPRRLSPLVPQEPSSQRGLGFIVVPYLDYGKAPILLKSKPQICIIGDNGGQSRRKHAGEFGIAGFDFGLPSLL
jgi:hypothetical protein